jgi:Protein of unknown function DUF262
MPTETLEKFFLGKLFAVPPFQRDYAWTERNVDDLLEDVAEAIDSNSAHYIGTFVLSKAGNDARYRVVDGQQRLTTLTMLISVLARELPTQQAAPRDFLTPLFLSFLPPSFLGRLTVHRSSSYWGRTGNSSLISYKTKIRILRPRAKSG